MLRDTDFPLKKINIKVDTYKKSNVIIKITPLEEIALLVMCLVDEVQDIKGNFKKIYEITKYNELFDYERFNLFKNLLNLELNNLISEDEKMEIEKELNMDVTEGVIMTPQLMDDIKKAIQEIDEKEIKIIEEKARNQGIKEGKLDGIKEGMKEGIEQGKMEGMREIIIKLKNFHSVDEIAEMLDLEIDYVKKIQS